MCVRTNKLNKNKSGLSTWKSPCAISAWNQPLKNTVDDEAKFHWVAPTLTAKLNSALCNLSKPNLNAFDIKFLLRKRELMRIILASCEKKHTVEQKPIRIFMACVSLWNKNSICKRPAEYLRIMRLKIQKLLKISARIFWSRNAPRSQ